MRIFHEQNQSKTWVLPVLAHMAPLELLIKKLIGEYLNRKKINNGETGPLYSWPSLVTCYKFDICLHITYEENCAVSSLGLVKVFAICLCMYALLFLYCYINIQ